MLKRLLPYFIRFVLVFLGAWLLSRTIGHLPLPKLSNGQFLVPGRGLGQPLPPGNSAWHIIWPAAVATAGRLAVAISFALLPAALIGIAWGRRPGSRLDRALHLPMLLLAGLPASLWMMIALSALLSARLLPMVAIVRVGLGLPVMVWLARFIRDGLVAAREASGRVHGGRAAALALGRCCQHGGHLLAMAVVADLIYDPRGYLGLVLRISVGSLDVVVAAQVLLFLAVAALSLRLVGDVVVDFANHPEWAEQEAPPIAASSPVSMAVGAMLVLLLLGICFLSFKNPLIHSYKELLLPAGTPGHPLGTDDLGRDVLARLSAGTRTSLEVGLEAALVAIVGGGLMGAVSGRLGRWGAITGPYTYAPMLMTPLLFGAAAVLFHRLGPVGFAWAFGLASVPLVSYPVRLLVQARVKQEPWQGHVLGLVGALPLVVGQAVATEAVLSLYGIGLFTPHVSLGLVVFDGLMSYRVAPLGFVVPALVVFMASGLFLLGQTLSDWSRRTTSEQAAPLTVG